MVSAGQLLAFAVASFIMIVIPGPSVLFVIGRALAHGRRTALATVVGNAAGVYVVAACVALGVGTLVERSAVVFTVVKLAGADHVGLGSDFDGADMPEGLDDCSKLPRITEALLRKGYSESDVRKILGENTLRLLDQAEKVSAEMQSQR